MSKVLITGSNGFLGKALCKSLLIKKYMIHASTRSKNHNFPQEIVNFDVGDICSKTKWQNALLNIECIIHCAARTHVMKEKKYNILKSYRKINVDGTKNLAIQAASMGVKRFIFISSIKVNGEQTIGSSSFNTSSIPSPEDAYGISKWEAEQTLWDISKKTGLEVVIIRPPLIYGEGVKGNFLNLLDIIYRGVPLPLASIKNKRSFVGLQNLIDLIIRCINNPKAAGNTFLISDLETVSTSELINKLAKLMNKSSNLFSLPTFLIKLIASLTGKSLEVKRLLSSLQVDSSKTREVLDWTPSFSLDEGLEKTVKWYLNSR